MEFSRGYVRCDLGGVISREAQSRGRCENPAGLVSTSRSTDLQSETQGRSWAVLLVLKQSYFSLKKVHYFCKHSGFVVI